MKAELVADQKAVLEERRDAACGELRESRDERYRELLDDQRALRAELRTRQEAGLDNSIFLQEAAEPFAAKDMAAHFRDTADEVATPDRSGTWHRDDHDVAVRSEDDGPSSNSSAHRGAGVGLRFGFGAG